ncbi:MAG: hypothetical protein APF81_17570 [Desulfosporosinus sp. BRH_c37]|nr:MAG: hypothetical protein APF81_17570 [Desulfosporosinus sp. BRH_c37]
MGYQIEGAIVKDQGITFAIVIVKDETIQNTSKSKEAMDAYRHIFPDMPIILLGRDSQGKSTYCGPKDMVNFLANVDPNRIPWRRYIITD